MARVSHDYIVEFWTTTSRLAHASSSISLICATQVEERVSQLLLRENKPFNVQTITDCLAQFGIKKGQVQKAVDALAAEGGGITCKVRYPC